MVEDTHNRLYFVRRFGCPFAVTTAVGRRGLQPSYSGATTFVYNSATTPWKLALGNGLQGWVLDTRHSPHTLFLYNQSSTRHPFSVFELTLTKVPKHVSEHWFDLARGLAYSYLLAQKQRLVVG